MRLQIRYGSSLSREWLPSRRLGYVSEVQLAAEWQITWYFSNIFQKSKILKSNSDNAFPAPSSAARNDRVGKTWCVFHCLHKGFVALVQPPLENNAEMENLCLCFSFSFFFFLFQMLQVKTLKRLAQFSAYWICTVWRNGFVRSWCMVKRF